MRILCITVVARFRGRLVGERVGKGQGEGGCDQQGQGRGQGWPVPGQETSTAKCSKRFYLHV